MGMLATRTVNGPRSGPRPNMPDSVPSFTNFYPAGPGSWNPALNGIVSGVVDPNPNPN